MNEQLQKYEDMAVKLTDVTVRINQKQYMVTL